MEHKALSLRQNKRAKEQAREAIARLFRALNDDFVQTVEMKRFDKSATEVLLAVDQNREPSTSALFCFAAALNGKLHHIQYRFGQRASKTEAQAIKDGWIGRADQIPNVDPQLSLWKNDRVRVIAGEWDFQMDAVRYAAEALKEYLELTGFCGPLHKSCALEGCKKISVGGQGNKRFCSEEHRKKFWSYSQQRDYFQRHQRINRRKRKEQQEKDRLEKMKSELKELEAQIQKSQKKKT